MCFSMKGASEADLAQIAAAIAGDDPEGRVDADEAAVTVVQTASGA